MKISRKLITVLGAAVMLTIAGCGTEEKAAEVTPTPAPTATPTAAPVTVTPAPTATPAPRVIGVKTSQAKFIYLTNSLESDLREIYLRVSGTEDWGKNLIPSESIVQKAEQVQMYYTADSSTDSSASESDSSAEGSSSEQSSGSLYDMKIVTADGDVYEIYSIEISDMEKASLTMDEDSGTAYLRYMSLASNSEKDTRENSQQTGYSDSSDDYDEEYYYEDTSDTYDSSQDSSDDTYYDDSSDDTYYDDSSDDTYYDDSSDDYYDNGSDDSYDDSGDYYDDSSDDSYVDAGDSSGDYSDPGTDYEDGEIPWDYE